TIEMRLNGIAFFLENADSRESVRRALKAAPDIARALGRLAIGRGGHRDLGAIRDGLKAARALRRGLETVRDPLGPAPGELDSALAQLMQGLSGCNTLSDRLDML